MCYPSREGKNDSEGSSEVSKMATTNAGLEGTGLREGLEWGYSLLGSTGRNYCPGLRGKGCLPGGHRGENGVTHGSSQALMSIEVCLDRS